MIFSNTVLACGFLCENSIADKNHGKFGEKPKIDNVFYCCFLWKTLQQPYPSLKLSNAVLLCSTFRDKIKWQWLSLRHSEAWRSNLARIAQVRSQVPLCISNNRTDVEEQLQLFKHNPYLR